MKKEETQIHSYQTGSTNPPKSYQGIITVLLILVIFLGGIISGLSMMNIRLFQMLENQNQQQEESLVQFSRQDAVAREADAHSIVLLTLGLSGQEVSQLCRSYYQWPEGLYVTQVEENSPAHLAGIQPGDILVSLGETATATQAETEQVVSRLTPGQHTAQVYRQNGNLELVLIVEE